MLIGDIVGTKKVGEGKAFSSDTFSEWNNTLTGDDFLSLPMYTGEYRILCKRCGETLFFKNDDTMRTNVTVSYKLISGRIIKSKGACCPNCLAMLGSNDYMIYKQGRFI